MENVNLEKQEITNSGFKKREELIFAGNEITAELFLECVSHPNDSLRSDSVRIVGEYAREDFIWIFAVALNDRSEHVVQEAAQALVRINSDQALKILSDLFFSNVFERPHQIANAISEFGQRGFDILVKGTTNSLPNIRYYSARFLGSMGFESAKEVLEKMEREDNEKTSFGGLVSTAARKSLKTYYKILERKSKTENN